MGIAPVHNVTAYIREPKHPFAGNMLYHLSFEELIEKCNRLHKSAENMQLLYCIHVSTS